MLAFLENLELRGRPALVLACLAARAFIGVIDYVTGFEIMFSVALLSAQQAYQQALIAFVQAQANRLSDTAALFQALGGGWWNRPEFSQSRP